MAAEAGIDEEEMFGGGFGEFEEENAGGEVVDVGETVVCYCGGELVGYDLPGCVSREKRREERREEERERRGVPGGREMRSAVSLW